MYLFYGSWILHFQVQFIVKKPLEIIFASSTHLWLENKFIFWLITIITNCQYKWFKTKIHSTTLRVGGWSYCNLRYVNNIWKKRKSKSKYIYFSKCGTIYNITPLSLTDILLNNKLSLLRLHYFYFFFHLHQRIIFVTDILFFSEVGE